MRRGRKYPHPTTIKQALKQMSRIETDIANNVAADLFDEHAEKMER